MVIKGVWLLTGLTVVLGQNVSLKFPQGLLFGAASSSYQVEGAASSNGKGPNIWDEFIYNNPFRIKDGSDANTTTDSYNKYKEDVRLLKNLKVNFYRFSISWPRIFPNGFTNEINEEGLAYYNNLIDELLANKIIPMVTMYHWDLPVPLQKLGGLANPSFVDWYQEYASFLFHKFGDRVKIWITFNEPKQICLYGYGRATFAPGIESAGIGDYLCTHHLLLAHARTYHTYNLFFRPKQHGLVGFTVECAWFEPETLALKDVQAAERKMQFDCGIYANPIFSKFGDYPAVVRETVDERSRKEGFHKSRLPRFTIKQVLSLQGSSDFFGINYYTTYMTRDAKEEPFGTPSQEKDARVETWQEDEWPGKKPFKEVPWGFRKMLSWVKINYNNPKIFITENGIPDADPVNDTARIQYLRNHLEMILEAIYFDNMRIKAYTVWSLLDSFEWNSGFTLKFGLHHVNFSDPNLERVPKASAKFYTQVIKDRRL